MLKVHLIKKKFFFLLKNVFWTVTSRPSGVPVSSPQPGQGSLCKTWWWQAQAKQPRGVLQAEAGPGSSKLQVRRWWWWKPVPPTSVFPQHSWFLSGSAWQKQTQRGEERVNQRGLHEVEEMERKHGSRTEGPSQPLLSTLLWLAPLSAHGPLPIVTSGSGICSGRHKDRQKDPPWFINLGFNSKGSAVTYWLSYWTMLCLHCFLWEPLLSCLLPSKLMCLPEKM